MLRMPLQERAAILRAHAKLLPLAPGVNFDALAAGCVGYTGADLAAVCRQAAMRALTSGVAAARCRRSAGKLTIRRNSSCKGPRLQLCKVPHSQHCLDLAHCACRAGTGRGVDHADFEAAAVETVPSLTRGAEVELARGKLDLITATKPPSRSSPHAPVAAWLRVLMVCLANRSSRLEGHQRAGGGAVAAVEFHSSWPLCGGPRQYPMVQLMPAEHLLVDGLH